MKFTKLNRCAVQAMPFAIWFFLPVTLYSFSNPGVPGAQFSCAGQYNSSGDVPGGTSCPGEQNPSRCSTSQDEETGLLYYGYRYYNASTGRWLSRDPAGENVGGRHLYAFVGNGPVGSIDTDGRLWTDPDGGRGPRPQPPAKPPQYPPQTPRGFEEYLDKQQYDCSCCGEKEVEKGYWKLYHRFLVAKNYLDDRGLQPDASGSGPGRASCFKSNDRILAFMEPTPRCWVCFIDTRRDPYWTVLTSIPHFDWWDENFIHCYVKSSQGIRREAIFDWFDSREHGDSGAYQDLSLYYSRPPHQDVQKPMTPHYVDCSQPDKQWRPNFGTLDILFTTRGDM